MSATAAAPPATVAGRTRAVYTGVAATGLLVVAAVPALFIVAMLVAGLFTLEEAGFFLVVLAATLVAAGVVWQFGTWAKAVGLLVALGAAGAMFWVVFGLAYPASFVDFVPGVMMPIGIVLAIGGSIAALVQGRRGHLESHATSGERRIIVGALAVIAVAAVASGGLAIAGRSTVAAAAGATPVSITDFEFAEGTYEVAAGEQVSMLVHNSDPVVHTFTIPALGIDETVLPGNDALVEFTADAGTYTVYCVPHSNTDEHDPAEAGMAATLVVE
jgi:plastocyanin